MAKPTTISFASFQILLEDSNSPNSFIAPCGFTSKSMNYNAAASETVIPDCDDPDAPPWTEAAATSFSVEVGGSGVMAEEAYDIWREAVGVSTNCRVVVGTLGWWAGPLLVTQLGQQVQLGSEGGKVQVSIQARNASEWTWHAGV